MARINDIAIDVGTANVLIYERGKGLISRTPAVVAVDRESGDILKFGQEAKDMVGRTPQHILTIYPLRDGTIKDFSLVNEMLQFFVAEAFEHKKHMFSRPRAMMTLPSNVNEMERNQLRKSLFDVGIGRTDMIDRCLAAVIGMNISMDDPTGTMVVDMGGSVTDISVVSMGHVVEHRCIPIGGEAFDEAIIRYLRLRYSLQIGALTAENLKIQSTTALKTTEKRDVPVAGRLITTNLPKKITITNHDLTDAIADPLQRLMDQIHDVLRHTDPALVADICNYGIVLSGGPANMPGLSDAIAISLNTPTVLADNIEQNIVIGCSYVLGNMRAYNEYLQGEQ